MGIPVRFKTGETIRIRIRIPKGIYYDSASASASACSKETLNLWTSSLKGRYETETNGTSILKILNSTSTGYSSTDKDINQKKKLRQRNSHGSCIIPGYHNQLL